MKKFIAVEVLILMAVLTCWALLRHWSWVPNQLTNREILVARNELMSCNKGIRLRKSELDSLTTARVALPNGFTEQRIRAVFNPTYYLGSEPPFESYPWLYQGPEPAIVLSAQDVHVQFVEYERNGWVLPSDAELPSYIRSHLPYLYPGWTATDMVRDVKKGMQEVNRAYSIIEEWDDRVAAARQLAGSDISKLEAERAMLLEKVRSLNKELIPDQKAEESARSATLYILILVYPIRIFLALFIWALRTVRTDA